MPPPPVHWFQGMFLRPHHFQAAERNWAHLGQTSGRWDTHFNWGLRSIDLDLKALENNTLVVRSLQARMRDGTVIEAEADDLPQDDLKTKLRGAKLYVFLRVPQFRSEGGNVLTSADSDEVARYGRQHETVEDENQRGNAQSIDFRRLKLGLCTHEQPTPPEPGYDYLCLARIERGAKAGGVPQPVADYIPPLLACDAWPPLVNDVLQAVYHRIGKKIEELAGQFRAGRTAPGLAQAESGVLHQLGLLNEAYLLLHVLAFAKGVHPLTAYLELCRLAGQLAIFGRLRRAAELPPRYDHDDLGKCFYTVRAMINGLLDEIKPPRYEMEPFLITGAQLHATIKPEWVQRQWPMFIGVSSSLEPIECVRLLCGRLDMKVASKERVARAFTTGGDSLAFVPVRDPPVILPRGPQLVYFEIDRKPQAEPLWREALQTEKLAIQFNRTMKAESADADGGSLLRMKFGDSVQELEFTLYAVPPEQHGEAGAPAPAR
ncbi:MAG TPA: type VI secretion system baseplate subunit TssK [Gemmataceae bacterium]|nr:type VI secretion system baseplate subunit TssK [Gemmataceae bacterium]